MPVYKDSQRGTWYVSYSFKQGGKFKHVTKRGFKTKTEAKEWEKAHKDGKTEEKKEGLTFKQLAYMWEEYLDSSEDSKNDHHKHFEIRFANLYEKPIIDISKQDLIEWRSELGKTPYATITKNKTLSYVRGVYRFANEMYDVPNIATVLKNFKKTDKEATSEMEVWTPEEFEQFLSEVDEPEYKVFFEFLYWTGCRRGEAIALQKRHVKDHMVTIRYSQKLRVNGLKPTKTKNTRNITIDDTLWSHLQPYIIGRDGYVFGDPKGLHPTSIEERYKKAISRSGVKYIKLHNLRHSHATWLICNGVNIVAVSKRLGHASITQTLETYTHLLNQTDAEMMSKINSFRGEKEKDD